MATILEKFRTHIGETSANAYSLLPQAERAAVDRVITNYGDSFWTKTRAEQIKIILSKIGSVLTTRMISFLFIVGGVSLVIYELASLFPSKATEILKIADNTNLTDEQKAELLKNLKSTDWNQIAMYAVIGLAIIAVIYYMSMRK